MGMDFVALMKYGGPDERLMRVLDRLEAGSPTEVRTLPQLMREYGFNRGLDGPAFWEFRFRPELRDPRLGRRPRLPNLGVSLWLPEDFSLTFGPDAVEIYHLLRWRFFLTEPVLQRAMLDACACLGTLLGATDCVVTSDYSPVVQAFRQGMPFEDSLAAAGPEHGERPTLADLYREIQLPEVVRQIERPGRPAQTQYMRWDVDSPPPEGWQRVTTWDSQGYWRLAREPVRYEPLTWSVGGGPAGSSESTRSETVPSDENWWTTCGEPDAMLDHLLKQDCVSWRKVWLWACACMRRIWPCLTSEPARRAVEVVERFADNEVDQRVLGNAGNAVQRVRKGDAWANRAASLLAKLCSPRPLFPPADVSDAAVDVVVRGEESSERRASERKSQADLLRDIFGPLPFWPLPLNPVALRSNDGLVVKLAQGIYEERAWDRLPVLADALEDAGCRDAEILAHCRQPGPGPHVRGCWVVDLLLGRG